VPEEQIPMEDLNAKEDLSYQEYLVKILDTSRRVTRNRRLKMCKVRWSHHTEEELCKIGCSRCARCNGVTIPRKRLHGKEKKS
jgi:hypothetical protein